MAEGSIVAIAVDRARAIELRMVKGVEGFEAEFQRSGFRDPGELVQSHIVVSREERREMWWTERLRTNALGGRSICTNF